jgi:hypothetical protein
VDLAGSFVEGDGPPEAAHVTDMCPGGAFLEVERIPPFGTQIQLTIKVPASDITVTATVRWAKGKGMGVQFAPIGARITYLITEHLADLEEIPDSRRYEG